MAHAHQTHYCTYIRVPKLLSLQQPRGDHPDELLAVLALQAFELWFKVLLNDLAAVPAELQSSPGGVQLPKLLNRASRLVRLLDGQADVTETILLHDLGLRLSLDVDPGEQPSDQFRRLKALTERTATTLAQAAAEDPRLLRAGQDYLGRFWRWSPRFEQLLQTLIHPAGAGAPRYSQYLHLETLLDLQAGVKADWTPIGQTPQGHSPTEDVSPDELLFVVVHQVFELWFRAQLHELDAVLLNLASELPDAAGASRRMRRLVRLQRLLVDMIHIPATMLPLDFLQFRAQTKILDGVTHERGLSPASGTESYQFRELEISAGLKENAAHAELLHGNRRLHIRFLTPAQAQRLNQPSLPPAFRHALEARGVQDLLGIFQPAQVSNPHADLAELADLLLEFDEFFQLWRMNHLTMVQSMIGRKSGTGFLGPEYLKETVGMGIQAEDDRLLPTPQIRPRFFEDLWEARTRMRAEGRGSDG